MIRSEIIITVFLFTLAGCMGSQKNYPEMKMSADEIVQAMINAYSVNAAIQLNDATVADSVSGIYFSQLSAFTGRSPEFLRAEFEKLLLMPDSMLVLQNRALDSLRLMQEKSLQATSVSIGLN
jgi:hypothetical protein